MSDDQNLTKNAVPAGEREPAPNTQDGRHSGNARQYVTFRVGNEEYGVDILSVREIKGWAETTRLPNSPPWVCGVLNLRGVIVPVVDLRLRLGLEKTNPTSLNVIVIINVRDRLFGLLVDSVSDIVLVSPNDIHPVPEIERGRNTAFLSGLATFEERIVAILNLSALVDTLGLNDEALLAMEHDQLQSALHTA